ncbi:MAG TPA: SRPBCC family protein [Thermoanaerobaculia bacterium]|jgi:carbon monoxide dehydrogenase subunit G|nr:SRPBCC family protein [Thermoanaerobaculia bacterium]
MNAPNPSTLTTAPLRHRIRLELHAPVAEVWSLVGDHERLPEYSEGIERVTIVEDDEGRARVCHFRPQDGVSMSIRERIRWEAPNTGYATTSEPGNDFGLTNDATIVTLEPTPAGTSFTWAQHYDHPDLPFMRAGFHQGLLDIARRLLARFGGRMVEELVDEPVQMG